MSKTIYDAMKATDHLPSPKGVALEILRLSQLQDVEFDEIASVIESDPAISARLLKLVNSPIAGTSRQIACMRQALSLLGLNTVKCLALGFSLIENTKKDRCARFDYGRFWADSLARAVALRHVAARLKSIPPEEAFTCGLLSQIGRLALATVFPESYCEVLRFADPDVADSLSKQEWEVLSIEHNELTARMMEDWGLPAYFSAAVFRQESVDRDEAKPDDQSHLLRRMLHLGGVIARIITEHSIPRELLATMTRTAHRLDIDPDVLQFLFENISEDWRQAGTLFSVPTRPVPVLAEIYALATGRDSSTPVADSNANA